MRDYLEYRQQNLWDRIQADYDLYIAIFGKTKADEWLERQRPVHLAMEKLWKVKNFKNYGDFEDWERDHKPERNEFLKKGGVWELWLNG